MRNVAYMFDSEIEIELEGNVVGSISELERKYLRAIKSFKNIANKRRARI